MSNAFQTVPILIHLDLKRCPAGVYMSVCLPACLFSPLQKMSEKNVRIKYPQKNVRKKCPLWICDRRENRSAGLGLKKMKKIKKLPSVQNPYFAISKINQIIWYSTYIASYRS